MTDDTISTPARTLRLVELLLASPAGLTPQELHDQLAGSRSALFLLLTELKSLGYIEQVEKRGRYRAGARLSAWQPSAAAPSASLIQAFYQEATRLPSDETLALAIASPAGALVLAQVEGRQSVRCAFTPGQVYPDLAAAQRVLAFDPIPAVRTNGCAQALSGDRLDLALPICLDGSHPAGALLLSAPAFRWQPQSFTETHLPELRAAAARLSYRLGAPFYTPFRPDGETEISPAAPLTPAEITRFLQGPWTARLACIRPDGRPHVIPVWQEWDGAVFHVIAWQGSQWAGFLLQNPNVSLTIDEPWPPLRRVVSRGLAETLDDHTDLNPLLERLSRRYLGQPAPPAQVLRAFRIHPETLRGWQGL